MTQKTPQTPPAVADAQPAPPSQAEVRDRVIEQEAHRRVAMSIGEAIMNAQVMQVRAEYAEGQEQQLVRRVGEIEGELDDLKALISRPATPPQPLDPPGPA